MGGTVRVGRIETTDGSAITDLMAAFMYGCISGKLSAAGYVACISVASNTSITMLSNATDGYVKILYSDGVYETEINRTITVAAGDATYYIIKEKNTASVAVTGYTESPAPPTGGASGDYWLCTGVYPHIPYKNIAGTWTVTQFVKMFKLLKASGTLTVPNQMYRIGPSAYYNE